VLTSQDANPKQIQIYATNGARCTKKALGGSATKTLLSATLKVNIEEKGRAWTKSKKYFMDDPRVKTLHA
jgi:hypothetical protein